MNYYGDPTTATGNPVDLSTTTGIKLLSVTAPFTPAQDLSGYPAAWAGGCGKNILPKTNRTSATISDVEVTVMEDGSIYLYGTASANIIIGFPTNPATLDLSVNGSYTLSGGLSNGCYLTLYDGTDNTGTRYNDYGSGVTFTCTTGHAYAPRLVITSGTFVNRVTVYPMLRLSSMSADWEPYENICPIVGKTELSAFVNTTYTTTGAREYTATWNENGIVYGGTVDHVSGVVTVSYAMVDLGDLPWVVQGDWKVTLPDAKAGFTNAYCDKRQLVSSFTTGIYQQVKPKSASEKVLLIRDYTISNATQFKASVAGVKFVYELATPFTVQGVPSGLEVKKGANYVWQDEPGNLTAVYAPLLFVKQMFTVNGKDFSGFVERDSYRTAVTPVYGETITTLNGVDHTALLRLKGSLTVGLNPHTDEETAELCAELLKTPCTVVYKCLQRNTTVAASMTLSQISAEFLSRCLWLGHSWNQTQDITLTEL